LPKVILASAELPRAVLLKHPWHAVSAFAPMAVLSAPGSLPASALYPIAVFSASAVTNMFKLPYPNEAEAVKESIYADKTLFILIAKGVLSVVPIKLEAGLVAPLPFNPHPLLAIIFCQLGDPGIPIFTIN